MSDLAAVAGMAPRDFPFADLSLAGRRMGFEAQGITLEHLDDAGFAAVEEMLLTHSVIVFRNQALSPEAQVRFSERFGPLEVSLYRQFTNESFPPLLVISNVKKDGKPIGAAHVGKRWHTDFSFMELCGYATILYGIEVPPVGADTAFADMYAAYDALDDATKREIDGMQVLHSYRLRYKDGGLSAAQLDRCPDVVHPLVRTHPKTGRKALFLGCVESAFAQGMSLEDGNAFMRRMIAFATQDRFVYSHKWRVGDVLVWDNAAVMHTATPFDEAKYNRTLHRTSTIGGRPF
ncbi:TauD/TfdA dioxygenase family protein [Falsiroseomonas oryzae]|uniref:TauD/TfdA dioxygenase family protein n=1 Tax=Falsiroseomonas oryzae TaxID=2766473 RepID=UPI0022EABC15|nr:TauD/TfdA family dioxygenase [Roseomonas sp. MO-31]